jgi:hypothetical protein
MSMKKSNGLIWIYFLGQYYLEDQSGFTKRPGRKKMNSCIALDERFLKIHYFDKQEKGGRQQR